MYSSFLLFISLDIIKSWVSQIDENGWVAREQILGAEARSKVRLMFTRKKTQLLSSNK
jgi:mannosyl-oligosaccharide glucosidase